MDGTVDDGLLEEAAVLGCARGAEEGWFVLEKALELDWAAVEVNGKWKGMWDEEDMRAEALALEAVLAELSEIAKAEVVLGTQPAAAGEAADDNMASTEVGTGTLVKNPSAFVGRIAVACGASATTLDPVVMIGDWWGDDDDERVSARLIVVIIISAASVGVEAAILYYQRAHSTNSVMGMTSSNFFTIGHVRKKWNEKVAKITFFRHFLFAIGFSLKP